MADETVIIIYLFMILFNYLYNYLAQKLQI
jgi:hypothetical protein